MSKHYREYFWKNGFPQGISALSSNDEIHGLTYKLISDPYHKRISIEKYTDDVFQCVIYDSALFDFRHLHPAEQTAWQKTIISDTDNQMICHIRNHDDRLILIEDYKFEKGLCRTCLISSPLGVLLSTQKIFYSSLGDSFDGVSLCDTNDHPVITKRYIFDTERQEFTKLIEEKWDMSIN